MTRRRISPLTGDRATVALARQRRSRRDGSTRWTAGRRWPGRPRSRAVGGQRRAAAATVRRRPRSGAASASAGVGRRDARRSDGVGDRPRTVQVLRHPGQPAAQAGQRGRRTGPQAEQRAAHAAAPLAHLRDDVLRAGQAAAGQRADPLVEADVGGVEEGGDLGRRPAVAGRASHSRAPSRWAAAPRSRAQATWRLQRVPAGQLPAEVALRQLDHQRGRRLGHRGQVGERRAAGPVADGRPTRPCSRSSARPSCRSRWHSGWKTTVRRRRRSACTRSADCWAMVRSAGRPPPAARAPAISASSSATSRRRRSGPPRCRAGCGEQVVGA